MVKILLINGPPSSGKDTIGHFFDEKQKTLVTKFAKAVKLQTHRLFNLSFPHDYFDSVKDVPNEFFNGLTPRQAYIAVSEKLMKPLFGERYYGDIVAAEIKEKRPEFVVITDSGFTPEAFSLVEAFGADNILLFKLFRTGTSFKDDSRGYIDLVGVKRWQIDNFGTLRDLRIDVCNALMQTNGFAKYTPFQTV